YRTNVLVGAGDNGRAAWATEVMVLECQTRGSVEGLHAVSLGDLFDIRRAVWRVWGHGLHGRALEPRRTMDCGQGSNGTSGAATHRCGRAQLIPHLFTCRSALTTGADSFNCLLRALTLLRRSLDDFRDAPSVYRGMATIRPDGSGHMWEARSSVPIKDLGKQREAA